MEHSGYKVEIPKPGEQIQFSERDRLQITEGRLESSRTVRIADARPHGFGDVELIGWAIDGHGLPTGSVKMVVPMTTVDARRTHRRGTH